MRRSCPRRGGRGWPGKPEDTRSPAAVQGRSQVGTAASSALSVFCWCTPTCHQPHKAEVRWALQPLALCLSVVNAVVGICARLELGGRCSCSEYLAWICQSVPASPSLGCPSRALTSSAIACCCPQPWNAICRWVLKLQVLCLLTAVARRHPQVCKAESSWVWDLFRRTASTDSRTGTATAAEGIACWNSEGEAFGPRLQL